MTKIKSVPDLARKEILAALAASVLFAGFAAFFDAPLGAPADPSALSPQNVKAPWIFVGIQQLLKYLPAIIAGVILPALALAVIALMPTIECRKGILSMAAFVFIIATAVLMTVWGYFS